MVGSVYQCNVADSSNQARGMMVAELGDHRISGLAVCRSYLDFDELMMRHGYYRQLYELLQRSPD